MILNFRFSKYLALVIAAIVPSIAFMMGLIFFNLLYAMIYWIVFVITTIIIGGLFIIRHPFLQVLEGKGLLVLDINSRGIVQTFIAKIIPPYIKSKIFGKDVSSLFDRKSTYFMNAPKTATLEEKGDDIILRIKQDDYNKFGFKVLSLPTVIYNSQIGEFLDKGMLEKVETKMFTKNKLLYVGKKVEEQSMQIRDFARYIVEQTKKSDTIFGMNKKLLIIILIAIGAVVIGALLLPNVLKTTSAIAGTVAQPISAR